MPFQNIIKARLKEVGKNEYSYNPLNDALGVRRFGLTPIRKKKCFLNTQMILVMKPSRTI